MTVGVACWRCGKPGHVAAECKPPAAKDPKELQARIDFLVNQWVSGIITIRQKREWIAAENREFEKARKAA